MQKRFYDQNEDNGQPFEKLSITGKLTELDKMLTEYHKQNPEKAPPDANHILQRYSTLSQDCYQFYSEVIARIQEGRVGKRSWVEAGGRPTPNG